MPANGIAFSSVGACQYTHLPSGEGTLFMHGSLLIHQADNDYREYVIIHIRLYIIGTRI